MTSPPAGPAAQPGRVDVADQATPTRAPPGEPTPDSAVDERDEATAPEPGAAAREADGAEPAPVEGRWTELLSLIGPTTVITALLLYFGFVGTRARFEYFGVNLDLADLSNQDLVLYGTEVLYVPAAVIFTAVLVAVAAHAWVLWLLGAATRSGACLTLAAFAALLGLLLTGRGLLGLLIARISRAEQPGTSALALALGPVLIGYGVWITARALTHRQTGSATVRRLAAWYGSHQIRRLRRTATVAVVGLVLAGLFWAANSFAWSFGQGRAYNDALELPTQPEVVLDTKDRLIDPPEGVTELPLPSADAASYRYRYSGLRLLLEAGGRLFLVPQHWTANSRTLVVPYDANIRVQLLPAQQ